ncbi:lia operon protein LiaF [Bacillus tianshenii]|uniref:Lia operon protein LiaF n=1 Tax=Sutcliffiella tianshenii TaxID=1463404 RepID=A0ABS2P1B5_9BACI|nr:cell wall-active antibiotics response protein LiaF [Bacillus tianshenii]MBM7620756.1 lia operon protein LiaF [Bacillus tianshenii]
MKTFNQKIIAILLVLTGIMLLLVNLGVISLEIKEYFVTFYPVIIVLLGLKWLIESVLYGKKLLFISLVLVVFGSLLLMDRLGYLVFEFGMVWKLWPLLFIYFGLQLFTKKRPVKITVTKGDYDFDLFSKDEDIDISNEEKEDPTHQKKVITIGELKMNKPNWAVEPLTLKTVVGDYYFDFSKAYIPDKETKIRIKGVVADLKMLIPDDLPIRIESSVKIGKIRVFDESSQGKKCRVSYESPNYESATRKLDIELDLKIGDVRIDRI